MHSLLKSVLLKTENDYENTLVEISLNCYCFSVILKEFIKDSKYGVAKVSINISILFRKTKDTKPKLLPYCFKKSNFCNVLKRNITRLK